MQRHQSVFVSLPVYPFCSFSSFSPLVSLSFQIDIPFFCVSQFRSFLSLHSRFLSLGFPPFFCCFSCSFSLCSGGIYRGGGRGVDPASSHRRLGMVPCCKSEGRRRRNSAASKRHRFVSFVFFLNL